MKDLRIPNSSEQFIDLSEINNSFRGLIIAYNGNSATGYIQYCCDTWCYLDEINEGYPVETSYTPIDLIRKLIESNKCTHFKVIEF